MKQNIEKIDDTYRRFTFTFIRYEDNSLQVSVANPNGQNIQTDLIEAIDKERYLDQMTDAIDEQLDN